MRKLNHIVYGMAAACAALLSACSSTPRSAAEMQPGYVTIETHSERVLYSQNADEKRPIGMLANIATAIVILDWVQSHGISMDTLLTVPAEATQWRSTNLLNLLVGEKISLRDALHSCIMWDDSACAITLAHACGSGLSMTDPEGAFVAQMNQMARGYLKMTTTRFKGSSGATVSYSTARDMALLGMYAINKPAFQSICSKKQYTATVYNPMMGARGVLITNSNRLLSNSTVNGIKAARSRSAGSCIIASATRGSVKRLNPQTGQESTYAQRMLVVLLGEHDSNRRYTFTNEMLNKGWQAWDSWLSTGDFSDRTKYIQLPH